MLLATASCAATPAPSAAPRPSLADSSGSEVPAGETGAGTPSGRIAFSADWDAGDIHIAEDGAAAHRIVGVDDDGIMHQCPAFAPVGGNLAFGRASGDDDEGWRDAAVVIANVTSEGEPSIIQAFELDTLTNAPCPIWSPDGRWIAFGALTDGRHPREPAPEVCIIDVRSGEIRRLTGLSTTDVDWAPDSSQLYIADSSGVLIYSLADSQTRIIDDTAPAKALTVSPDGRMLAVERRRISAADRYELWQMNANGSDQRKLVDEYTRMHGIGPMWSPDGRHVVFQRARATCASVGEQLDSCPEQHEVVLLTIVDDDPASPVGAQTVLPPPQTGEGDDRLLWFPYSVVWSPDGTSLMYLGWPESGDFDEPPEAGYEGVLVISVDGSTPPVIVYQGEGIRVYSSKPMNTFQSWGWG
jgi:hypothetical protein